MACSRNGRGQLGNSLQAAAAQAAEVVPCLHQNEEKLGTSCRFAFAEAQLSVGASPFAVMKVW